MLITKVSRQKRIIQGKYLYRKCLILDTGELLRKMLSYFNFLFEIKTNIYKFETFLGMDGYLVGPADFKSVAPAQACRWVGSIPTHTRFFL